MATASILLAALVTLTVFSVCLQLAIASRTMRRLSDMPIEIAGQWPLVSIVVAARNEERDIEPAVRSLLALDYPSYELWVVNDRSTDRTGPLLDQIAVESPRLKVVHIQELPQHWLGKNHALWFGAERAKGKWILFTDADVIFHPQTLLRAIGFVEREKVDHLALFPGIVMSGSMLQAFVVAFSILFSVFTRPWKVRDPKSSAYVGIGAFNLVKGTAYEGMGTHRALAMRPDDDIKLGKLIKKHGYVQDVLAGGDMVRVPWYASVREVIQGLMKNAFSALDYNVPLLVGSSLALLASNVFPFIALLLTTGAAWWLHLASVVMLICLAQQAARELKTSPLAGLLYPLAILLFVYIQWRAMLLTYWNDGIRWRGTHYSLAELKANRV